MRKSFWMALLLLGLASTVSCGGASERDGGTAGAGGGSGNGSGCEYNGVVYAAGDSFPAEDGCNTCSCDDGTLGCTEIACNSCDSIEQRWSAALQRAKSCDPSDPNSCTATALVGLPCACDTFVNPAQDQATAELVLAQAEFQAAACFGPVACEPCLPPASGLCLHSGQCVDISLGAHAGAACLVEGEFFPSGTTITSPSECSTCDCIDGTLICSGDDCSIDCQLDSTFLSRCAECSPAGGCAVVEYACLRECGSSASCNPGEGSCIAGVCSLECD
jgi:hypothetical protein